jgi:hypothetical protein
MKKAVVYLLSILILSAYSFYFIIVYNINNKIITYLTYPLILFLIFPLEIVDFIPKALGFGCDSRFLFFGSEFSPNCSAYYVYPLYTILLLLEFAVLVLIIAFISHKLKKH